jgi:probable LLM family oxidoreductase
MELGLYTFADTHPHPSGWATNARQALRDLMEQIELADQVGLDVFGVGEHHRADYAVAAPVVVLAAAAERTSRIRLTSAVTVLSSDDPVRIFQEFATLDLLSGGRAEIIVGRGSFIESFPLFGYSLDDYDALFIEKVDLLLQLRRDASANARTSWTGKHRAPLRNQPIFPRPLQPELPIWIAVGGTPQSVVRAARLGVPMALAIIGGTPARFAPLVELYRETARDASHDPSRLAVSINSHSFVGETSLEAADAFYPAYVDVMTRIGHERGWPPTNRRQFDASRSAHGALVVGSVQEVIDKILYEHELFGHQRFMAQMTVGTASQAAVMRSIELYGTRVAPAVRAALGVERSMVTTG